MSEVEKGEGCGEVYGSRGCGGCGGCEEGVESGDEDGGVAGVLGVYGGGDPAAGAEESATGVEMRFEGEGLSAEGRIGSESLVEVCFVVGQGLAHVFFVGPWEEGVAEDGFSSDVERIGGRGFSCRRGGRGLGGRCPERDKG